MPTVYTGAYDSDRSKEDLAGELKELRSRIASLEDEVSQCQLREASLRTSDDFLDKIFDSIQDGISILDKDLNIVRVNHVMEEWYSHVMPLKGKKCYYVYHGRSEPCEICPSLRALKQNTAQSDMVPFQGESGEHKGWQEIFAFPITDERGSTSGVIEHVRDITERKRAEEALRESEEKFRVLAETTRAGIMLYRGDRFIYVNSSLENISGYTKEELLSMNYWDAVHPESRNLVRSRGTARQNGLPVPSKYELKILTRDGETRWVEFSAAMINYKGDQTGIATIFDITDRKRSEEELQEAKAQSELYLDLMGHDINNMNQIGIGFLEMALGTIRLDEASKELIQKPLEALEASTKLIANVRKLQKAKEGGLKFHEIDVNATIKGVVARYADIPGRDVLIKCFKDDKCDSRVIANDLLDDVFANIIGNAIKHSTGLLRIEIYLSDAVVGGRRYCLVAIEDDGPGIPDNLKNEVFARFKRSNTKMSGRGLGLYLVRTLVEDFQGRTWVEDRVPGDHKKGTRFVVMLPAVNPGP